MPKPLPEPHRKRWYKRWWVWTLIILIVLGVLGSMVGQSAYRQFQKDSLSYLKDTTQPEVRTLKKTITTNGTIVADQQVQLGFTAGTKVKHVNYQVGDLVSKDDVIADSDFQKIKAPFDGRILAITTFVDDVITPGAPVIIVGFRGTHIEFTASESEVVDLTTDQTATITVPAVNDGKDTYTGRVQFIDLQKQAVTGSALSASGSSDAGYLVKITADNLPEELRQTLGLSVDVVITVAQKDSALSLAPAAIQYEDEDTTTTNTAFVYLAPTLDEAFYEQAMSQPEVTELLTKRTITTGFVGDDYIEITSGLTEAETVLTFLPKTEAPASFF